MKFSAVHPLGLGQKATMKAANISIFACFIWVGPVQWHRKRLSEPRAKITHLKCLMGFFYEISPAALIELGELLVWKKTLADEFQSLFVFPVSGLFADGFLILFLIYNYSQTNLNGACSVYFRLVSSTVRPPALSALCCVSKATWCPCQSWGKEDREPSYKRKL